MEALMMLVILVFMIMTMFVINLVSRPSRRYESRSQEQGFFSIDPFLFHVFITPDVIGEVIEGMAEVGTAIVEVVGTILEVTVDIIDL